MTQVKNNDLYCIEHDFPLMEDNTRYGTVRTRYEVRAIVDVRNLSSLRAYRIRCSQRILVPNLTPFAVGPIAGGLFSNYPALIGCNMSVNAAATANLEMIDYAPKTLNTTVLTAESQSAGQTGTMSQSHTAGSSTAQTNSYGASVTVGLFDASVTADYGYSATTGSETSDTNGSDRGSNSDSGGSQSMSVKDWASYAQLDASAVSPTWTWGQEYPWDMFQYRLLAPNSKTNIDIPSFIYDRLFVSTILPGESAPSTLPSPPSQLSQFGVDFKMQATWHAELPTSLDDQTITIAHDIKYSTATHGIMPNNEQVTQISAPIDFPWASPLLDLTLLGLDPISHDDATAVVAFVQNKFVCPPAAGAAFKILSSANNLQVSGSGFDDVMTSSFSKPVVMSIQFKVTDDINNYTLNLKHWKTAKTGCSLTVIFNGDASNPVTYLLDAKQGEGGSNNITAIVLRNTDFTSIDYHDYLVLGLNTVEITVKPVTSSGASGYAIRALAIEQS